MSSSSSSQILCVGPFEFPTASILLTREGGGWNWNTGIWIFVYRLNHFQGNINIEVFRRGVIEYRK